MKQITFFTQNLDTGGVQKSVSSLANYLCKFFTVSIVLAEDNKALRYELDPNIFVYKIKTQKIDVKTKGIGKRIFDYRVRELQEILEKIKTDLVISYEDYNNLILLQTHNECKKVISCRVSLNDSYTEKSFIHLLPKRFYFEMIQKYYAKADLLVCVSRNIEHEIVSLVPEAKSCTIYNGIKIPFLGDKTIEQKNFILNVGRLHHQKGQRDLIEAFDSIKDHVAQNMLIVGEGELKDELTELVIEKGLSHRVFFTGFQDPFPFISQCDLFVFPSYYEGFSNAILEVMSMQKAIVSYSYKGAEEILPSESLVSLGDIDSLAKKILYYLKHKERLLYLEQKLFKIAKEFTPEKTFEGFHRRLEQLLR